MNAATHPAAVDAAILPRIVTATAAKPAGDRFSFRCPLPNHGKGGGDLNPSAVLWQDQDGRLAVHCFAGCDGFELWTAVVKPHLPRKADNWETYLIATYPAPADGSGRGPANVYRKECAGPACDYKGCNGKTNKHIWQHTQGKKKGGIKGYPVLLWGKDDNPDLPVIIAEGEKTAAAIAAAGRLAVSYIGGCALAGKADFSALTGRNILHWPDNDKKGIEAAEKAAAAIAANGIAYSQTILPPIGKPGSGNDAADLPDNESIRRHIDAGGRAYIPPAPAAKPAAALAPNDKNAGLKIGGYYDIGGWYGRRLTAEFRYDPDLCAWYRYDGGIWIELDKRQLFPAILAPFIANRFTLADELTKEYGVEEMKMAAMRMISAGDAAGWINHDGGVLGGIRQSLTAPLPIPPLHLIGTPGGVLDLRNGQLLPHSPDFGIRCLTAGRYRPEDSDYLFDRLAVERYAIPANPILTPANLDTLINQVGLTLTGRACHLTALTLIIGLSGSSKTNTVSLVKQALGGYAMAAPENLLEPCRSDIDYGIADIIDYQPRMLAHDEISADSHISIKKLLGLTGYKELTARRPHGTPRHGKSIAAIWTTAVDTPQWPAAQGMRRRLSIIETARQLADHEKTFSFDQDFLDAIITLGGRAAAAVYQDGYIPPYGEEKARRQILADMDALGDWIMRLESDWHGKETNAARAAYAEEMEIEVSATKFAAAVKGSGRWKIGNKSTSTRKNIRVMELIDNPLL